MAEKNRWQIYVVNRWQRKTHKTKIQKVAHLPASLASKVPSIQSVVRRSMAVAGWGGSQMTARNFVSRRVAGTSGQETYGLEHVPAAAGQRRHGTDRGQPKGWPPCLLTDVQAMQLTPLPCCALTA